MAAPVYAPLTAFTYVQTMVKNPPLVDVKGNILQAAADTIWTAAPWRWSVGVLGPTTLATGTQDYVISGYPSDFCYLERAYVKDTATQTELTPVGQLNAATSPALPGMPVYATILTASSSVRFDNVLPAEGSGGTRYFLGYYKKSSPILTAPYTTTGSLIMPDDYSWVYMEAVLYYGYKYMDDARAGSATVAKSSDGKVQVQYSGQYGVMMAAIEFMRQAENLVAGYPIANPSVVKDLSSWQTRV